MSTCGADTDGKSWSQLIQTLDRGSFDQVTFLDRTLHDMLVCTTEHAVLVKVGDPREDLEQVPGNAQDVLDFLDGMDRGDLDWDLDGNGKVDHADLSMLLGSPTCSP